MEIVITVIIAYLSGISFLVYRHPRQSRKLIMISAVIIGATDIIASSFFLGTKTALVETFKQNPTITLLSQRIDYFDNLLFWSYIILFGALVYFAVFTGLSVFFEDIKKKESTP